MQTFYNGVTHAMWSTIDAAMLVSLTSETKDEAYNFIDRDDAQ